MNIILASKSPRRKEILEKFGYEFSVEISNTKEQKLDKAKSIEEIEKVILNNSALKAKSVLSNHKNQNLVVISADTTVVLENMCLNKPRNTNEAFLCLKKLSGKAHIVLSAITAANKDKIISKIDRSKVYFRNLSDTEITNYIETFNPLDKAGSYGIQDFIKPDLVIPSDSFIKKIEGSYYNIMGICPEFLSKLLKELG